MEREILDQSDDLYRQYYNELAARRSECDDMLEQINLTLDALNDLNNEYKFVSNKTHSLNSGSEKLIAEQNQLIEIADEIKKRLHYFTQAEHLLQLLQSPTISVSSEIFAQALERIDTCIAYIREHVSGAIDHPKASRIISARLFCSPISKTLPHSHRNTTSAWPKQLF